VSVQPPYYRRNIVFRRRILANNIKTDQEEGYDKQYSNIFLGLVATSKNLS